MSDVSMLKECVMLDNIARYVGAMARLVSHVFFNI